MFKAIFLGTTKFRVALKSLPGHYPRMPPVAPRLGKNRAKFYCRSSKIDTKLNRFKQVLLFWLKLAMPGAATCQRVGFARALLPKCKTIVDRSCIMHSTWYEPVTGIEILLLSIQSSPCSPLLRHSSVSSDVSAGNCSKRRMPAIDVSAGWFVAICGNTKYRTLCRSLDRGGNSRRPGVIFTPKTIGNCSVRW